MVSTRKRVDSDVKTMHDKRTRLISVAMTELRIATLSPIKDDTYTVPITDSREAQYVRKNIAFDQVKGFLVNAATLVGGDETPASSTWDARCW